MNARALAVLGGITLAAVVGAAVVMSLPRSGGAASAEQTGLLLPALAENVNAAAEITITDGQQTLVLARGEGGWVVRSKSDYPARIESIKPLLLNLADLEKLEPKTDDPQRYGAIGVQEPGAGNDAVGITVRDETGETIASLILGDRASTGRFARIAGDARAWLVGGAVAASPDAAQWIERSVMRIDAPSVRRVSFRHPDGEDFTVLRRPEGEGFTVLDLPADRAPNEQTLPRVASVLSYVTLTDVRALEDDEPPAEATSTTVETTGGMRITAYTWDEGGTTWASFDVGATGEAEEAAATKANELRAKVDGWAYQLQQGAVSMLRMRLDQVAPVGSADETAPEQVGPPTP